MFAPAGELVPVALRALDRGGTLAVAGIWLSDIPTLNYDATAVPGAEAAHVSPPTPEPTARRSSGWPNGSGVRATTVGYPMSAAPQALADLKHGRFSGAAVLHT